MKISVNSDDKGQLMWISRAVNVMLAVSLILMLALNTGEGLEKWIRIETVDVAADRVRGAVYMTDGLEHGRTEINFKDDYNLTRDEGKKYLDYRISSFKLPILSNKTKKEIESPTAFEIEEGRSEKFCALKKPGYDSVKLLPRGCKG